MICYRYRPWNDISVKELLYNEMYFSSADESNDPYEGKKFMEFKSEKSNWSKIFSSMAIFEDAKNLIPQAVKFFSSKASWSLNDIKSLKDEDLSFLQTDTKTNYRAWFLKQILENKFESLEKYFVSFSRDCRNTIMWSHYADKHKGFCLIFNFENNKVKQDSQRSKKALLVKEIFDIGPNSCFANPPLPEDFDLYDVDYLDKLEKFDILSYQKKEEKTKNAYLQKSKAWEYEEESRIILEMGSGVCGESKFSPFQLSILAKF